ncbi:uncharacterized protein LOC108698218 isoform X2 [Xenopus laevis]|uniref:Uncharacterized protein LOC108698218 isoform X2 n=1 Tax=Xenopus laevis TaxID=8355 RepID=A0A8J1LFM6_XENLA|nr:uncharacterized protein LOC108698218 isoform X2 [Xenopus laevis]
MAKKECTYILHTAYLIVILGGTAGHELITHKNCTTGTIGKSVLLPISYRLNQQFASYTIQWETSDWTILYYRVTNSTTDPQGSPTWENGEVTVFPKYKDRVQFFRLNGSLVLWDLQLNDTASYQVILTTAENITEKQISVTITETTISSDGHNMHSWETLFIFRTVLCFFIAFALVLLIVQCERHSARQADRCCTTSHTQG